MIRSFMLTWFFVLVLATNSFAQNPIKHIEPPYWWTGMNTNLQLLIYGENISSYEIHLSDADVKIDKINTTKNPNYVFIDITVSASLESKTVVFQFKKNNKIAFSQKYEFKKRESSTNKQMGFNSNDAIYLLMPDRFSNGNTNNDNLEGYADKTNRLNNDARHGGDLKGIANHLDYIAQLGMTAIWINPLLENNMPKYSYHGYATTDFYKIDPRFGTNLEYKNLVDTAHSKKLKVIMDMIFNHCGSENWIYKDMPSEDWFHKWPEFTRSNYRSETLMDPHSSEIDKKYMGQGWFDNTMPDFNQTNPLVAKYLIQNSIWWIEYSGIDGIRMDTYQYADQKMMNNWILAVKAEYPNFSIVGECWMQRESHTAWFQKQYGICANTENQLENITDFPMQAAIANAFNEKDDWTQGLARLYYTLSQDYLYSNANNLVIFADNHDLSRCFSLYQNDLNKWKMAMTFLLFTRGIPMIYYGTEILMDGHKSNGDGGLRNDFPGGWQNDSINAFRSIGLTTNQTEASLYLSKLLNFRNSWSANNGKITQFVPQDGIYVFFKLNNTDSIMVIFNNDEKSKTLNLDRFEECLQNVKQGTNLISGETVSLLKSIVIPAKSSTILILN